MGGLPRSRPSLPSFFPRRFSRLRCNSLYHLNIAVYYLYSWNRLSPSSWLFKLPVVPMRAAVSMSLFQSLFCLFVHSFIYLFITPCRWTPNMCHISQAFQEKNLLCECTDDLFTVLYFRENFSCKIKPHGSLGW